MVLPDGTAYNCSYAASNADCGPYQVFLQDACSPPSGGCSASGVPSGAGGVDGEVFVILLALAAAGAMRRRFA